MVKWLLLLFPLSCFSQSKIADWVTSNQQDSITQFFASDAPDWSEKISIQDIEFEYLTIASTTLKEKDFKVYIDRVENITPEGLSTAYNYALQKEQFDNAKILLEQDAFDPDIPCSLCHGRTPLQQTILTTEGGNLIEQAWEKSKKDWNYQDDDKNSTLFYVVNAKQAYLLSLLGPEQIKAGRDTPNKSGITPFMLAAEQNMEALFSDMLEIGSSNPIQYGKHLTDGRQSLLNAALASGNKVILNNYLNNWGYSAEVWKKSANSVGIVGSLVSGQSFGLSYLLENEEFEELGAESFIQNLNEEPAYIDLIRIGLAEGWIQPSLLEIAYQRINDNDFWVDISFEEEWADEAPKEKSFISYFEQAAVDETAARKMMEDGN